MAKLIISDRASARERGAGFYFTGLPCVNGHSSLRRVSNGECKSCGISTKRKARLDDPTLSAREAKAWREKYPHKSKQYAAGYRAANRQYYREYNQGWAKRNPEFFSVRGHARRASILKAVPAWFGELDQFAIEEAAALCALRRSATGIKWAIDHMIPLKAKTASGLHVGDNLQVIPAAMNSAKRNRMQFTERGQWLRGIQ